MVDIYGQKLLRNGKDPFGFSEYQLLVGDMEQEVNGEHAFMEGWGLWLGEQHCKCKHSLMDHFDGVDISQCQHCRCVSFAVPKHLAWRGLLALLHPIKHGARLLLKAWREA